MRVASFSLKPSPSLFLLLAGLALVACGEDDPLQESPSPSAVGGASGQAGKGGVGGSSSGASGQSGEAGAAGSSAGNGGTAGAAGAAGEAGASGSAGNASAGQAGEGGQGGAGAGEGGMSGSSGQAGEAGGGAGGADAGSGGAEAAGEAGAGGSDPVGGSAGAGGSDAGAGGSDAGVGGDAGNGGSDAGSGGAGGGGNAGGSDGGTGGTGGTAGSGGASGMSGSSGQSGAGGQAGSAGQGGAGGQAPTPTVVAVLGRGLTPASALSFKASGGWTAPQDLNLFVQKTALSSYQGGAVAVARRASKIAAEQDELFWASWSPGAGFGNFAKVGNAGFGVGGPALASIGVAVELTFLGQDFKHYTAQLGESGAWSPFAAFPGGKAGEQAFGPSGAGLASRNVEAWAAYAGDNKTLYVSSKAGPGSSWGFSSAAPTSPVVNTIPPVIRAFDGGVTFAYVLDKNGRIALNTLQLPQNAWSGELTVGDSAITGSDFDFVRLGPDDYLVVWHGLDNDGIYYSRGGGGTWSAPAVVLSPGQPTSAPVVLPGLGDKLAEVLFSAGGTLRHARYDGVGFAVNEVISTSNALSVSATLLSSP